MAHRRQALNRFAEHPFACLLVWPKHRLVATTLFEFPTMAFRAALAAFLPLAAADKYAVIAAGSAGPEIPTARGFFNYRHQADACHAYHLMLKSGVPADNIILMMQDDVANSSENPFPGQLFNKPGDDSPDVYKGCKVDYSGDIVTGQLFMDVLTGNTQGAKGKVLKSGASDTVFVNFVDHGGPGIIAFPNGPVLTVKELSKTLKTMQSKHMFKEMVFYMEACESGSMFPDLEKDSKILAVTASNADESSWGTYCGDAAMVKGKNVGSCLGDLFSVNWMQDDDLGKFSSETFRSQIAKVTKLTNKSHVCSFGDKSFVDDTIGSVETTGRLSFSPVDAAHGAVDARDVYVTQAMWAWQNAANGESKDKVSSDCDRSDKLTYSRGDMLPRFASPDVQLESASNNVQCFAKPGLVMVMQGGRIREALAC
eukprot:s75_g14.t1